MGQIPGVAWLSWLSWLRLLVWLSWLRVFVFASADLESTSTVTASTTLDVKTSTGLPSFQCDAVTILGHSDGVALNSCTEGTCYASDLIYVCGGYGTQCCAPRISLCSSGATCFATTQIDTCMPWAACCAPKVNTCLSPSCSQNFPACTQT
ncbi:unnamed protein product [Symbiodinium pilosum]|uniref:Granulins domain-containing protein n=1 Tax=Symbiodinium pilosum TaxID=2952 RepID=A0A812T8N3_SYMPI|nr:unnamed protein product [Symbiodinium pilosum]